MHGEVVWELWKPVLNQVVLILKLIPRHWIGEGTEVAVPNFQGVPISQVALKTGFTVYNTIIFNVAVTSLASLVPELVYPAGTPAPITNTVGGPQLVDQLISSSFNLNACACSILDLVSSPAIPLCNARSQGEWYSANKLVMDSDKAKHMLYI